jgi:hypothetical protein
MKEIDRYHEVATAVRVESENKTGKIYIVFEITDEKFRHQIKTDWMQDIDLKIIDVKDGDKTLHKLVKL